ncbi:MAG: hypothetical protein H6807_03300 [Planctomycetes bacterium]|nr:hypothetical protein [Planctomycetota bacterium]
MKTLEDAPGSAEAQARHPLAIETEPTGRATTLNRLRHLLARKTQAGRGGTDRLATGWAALDQALGGGYLRAALNEIADLRAGSGLLEALLPALLQREHRPGGPTRFWAWVGRENPPYPPALAHLGFPLERWLVLRPRDLDEQLWALEQLLRSGLCRGLLSPLAGLGGRQEAALRRLQLAARDGDCTAFLLRSSRDLQRSSPAPLRLLARPLPALGRRRRLMIEVIKTRGRFDSRPVLLEWSHDALDAPPSSRGCLDEKELLRQAEPTTTTRALPA